MQGSVTQGSTRPLAALGVAQFLGAFVDYAWKLAITVLLQRGADAAGAQEIAELVTVAFVLPLAAGALPAMGIADRFSNRSLLIATKALEVVLVLAGIAVLALDPDGGRAALFVVGGLGVQSALFSPAKYGILPQITSHGELSRANGWIELATYVGIVSGTVAGPFLVDASGAQPWVAAAALAPLSILGLVLVARLPRVPPAGARSGPVETAREAVSAIRSDRILWLSVAGNALFFLIAAMLMQNVQVYSKIDLALREGLVGLPLSALSIGIGLGSLAAGRLSAKKVEIGLLPLGAIALAATTLAFGLAEPAVAGTFALLGAIGFSAGLLIVPLNALIQWRAPAARRGAVIALANLAVYVASIAGAVLCHRLARGFASADGGAVLALSTSGIFVAGALLIAGGAAWAVALAPQSLLRLVLVLATHSIYRLKVRGAERVPEKGGCLLVPNHVSFADGLFVIASLDRPVRFLVDAPFFDKPVVGRVLRWLDAIPISATGGPRMILRALRSAGDYLDQGHVVCIFAEGQITRTGMLLPFRRGMERITKGRKAPIVPVWLDGVWGSIFSFEGGRFLWKRPKRIPYHVGVSFGEPLAPGEPLSKVRAAVQRLGQEAWAERFVRARTLERRFVHRARTRPLAMLYADQSRGPVRRIEALAGAIALARALRRGWSGQEHVGILLPPTVAGALVNLAAAFAGKIAVNLNYTAGPAGMSSAAAQAKLSTVVTSRTFLEKAKLELPRGCEPIWIEDTARGIGAVSRAWAMALACLAPPRALARACGAARPPRPDDVATVIFSSGSTGEPKGVMLTHANIASNVAMLEQIFHVGSRERLLGILPFFHSFGYTATIWFPATSGIGSVFHPSPIDAPAIGALVEGYSVSFVLATPTLLSIYLRRIPPAQFGSVTLVLAGAEKLPQRLVDAFEEQFGIRPLEGYGTTECAPVVAASRPDFRSGGFYQPGWRRGFVGQPLPGILCRVVDPDTFEDLPPNTPGMLLVKGPNVMKGYLGRPDLTTKALRDGWYVTGDIALLDEDSFLKITDRLSRFSKIGGEMVPHGRIEDELHAAASATTPTFVVTAVPDEKKGERIAVITTLDLAQVPALLEKLARSGLPNLFLPRADAFVHVAALPVLGTGKTDLRAVKQIALEKLLGANSAST